MPFVDLNQAPRVLRAGYSDPKGEFFHGQKIRLALMTELEGEGARPHRHPDEQIIFIVQGKMWLRVAAEEKIRSEPFVDLTHMTALAADEMP